MKSILNNVEEAGKIGLNMKSIHALFFLIALIMSGDLLSQRESGVSDYLKTATIDESVKYQQRKYNYYQGLDLDLPMLEKLEFRTETNDFKPREQEMLIRAKPISKHVKKAQKDYNNTSLELIKKEVNVLLNQSLKSRYDRILKYHSHIQQLDYYRKQQILYADKVGLLRKSYALPGFNILDLLNAQEKEEEINRAVFDLENELRIIEKRINIDLSQDSQFRYDPSQLISIQDLKNTIDQLPELVPINHAELKAISLELESSKKEHDLVEAKNKWSLGFIQAKYGYDKDNPIVQNFSIGLGVEIPLKKIQSIGLVDKKADVFDKENKYVLHSNYLIYKSEVLMDKLFYYKNQHDFILDQINNSQAEYALREYQKHAGAPPLVILELRENTLKKEMIKWKLEVSIMQTFIDYLEAKGYLSDMPLRNYLSKGFEQL